MTIQEAPPVVGPAAATEPANRSTDDDNWSKPVGRLTVGDVPKGAINLNVEGRRLVGPMQGFGRLWQKRYRLMLDTPDLDPRALIATWKAEFPSFWPKGNRFYGPVTGIAPGEVALLNVDAGAHQMLSTGVLVIYADEESFTFMTPEGHIFAAWITFSAVRELGATVASVEVLLRANDPIYEVLLAMFGSRKEDAFWAATLHNLGTRFGVDAQSTQTQTCVDRRRQWRRAGNIRYNAALRTGFYTMTHPWIMFRHSVDT
jgi:hypothetical protein